MPPEKALIVKALQERGHRVAFVGDGINDGPGLAAADVGIAMGLTGTDLALKTAQIALPADELSTLSSSARPLAQSEAGDPPNLGSRSGFS